MKKSFLFLAFFLISTCSYAWVTNIGIDPLDQTSGAKPLSMGGAFAGASGDINCLFYNPASLANSKGIIVSANNAQSLSLGVAYETGIGNFGVGTVYKDYQMVRLNDTQKANYKSGIALASYGIGSDMLSVGVAIKGILSQSLGIPGTPDMASNSGTDYDAGILWKPIRYASFGAIIRNGSNTPFTLGLSEEAFPRSTRIGFVFDLLGKSSFFYNKDIGLKAAYDIESGNVGEDQKHDSFYGFEGSLRDWFFIRFGGSSTFKIDRTISSLSFGLGINFRGAEVDIATLKDPITETQISYLSLSYSPSEFALFKVPAKAEGVPKDLLKLVFPKDDYVTYDDFVVITGETRPRASVSINGEETDVSGDGKFMAIQPLISGKNLIEINASLDFDTKTIFRKILKKARVVIEEEVEIDKKIDQEVLSREADISSKEEELKKEKQKGIDVSKKEAALSKEKAKHEEIKAKLVEEKKKIEERKEKVENLVTLGVIEVSPEAKFKIEAPITRGEMISWLVKASGLALPSVEGPVFTDVPKSHRFAAQIKAALDAGLISAEAGGKFRPDDAVKESEGQEFFRSFGIVK
jgi:hypothetical protein